MSKAILEDAIEAIFSVIRLKPKFVLHADISNNQANEHSHVT